MQNAISKDKEIAGIEQSTEDIWQDWSDVCNKWFRLMEVLKVPKKSKGYEQNILRTMFFKRVEELVIDGHKYIVSNAALFDHFKCKELIIGLWAHINKEMTDSLDKNTYNGWKKDLSSKLKEWDRYYVKHQRNTNPELSQIHHASLLPLTNLMESNNNYYNFV